MRLKFLALAAIPLVGTALCCRALADIPVGVLAYDLSTPPNMAEFDIVNETGPNSSPSGDPTFPVSNTVHFSDLSLVVTFSGGSTETFGSSYFTPNADGISFNGTPMSTSDAPPVGIDGAVSAMLSGMFDTTTFDLNDGSTVTVDSSFSALLSDPGGLMDQDLVPIYAKPAGSGPPPPPTPTPEPESLVLLGTGLAGLIGLRRRALGGYVRRFASASRRGHVALAITGLLVASAAASAGAQVKLNTWSSPSSGLAGSTVLVLSGSGFPTGTISPTAVTLTFSSSCKGTSKATEMAKSVSTVLGSSDRVQFLTPASLTTGNYFVSIAGHSAGGTSFSSTDCSELSVTQTTTALASCVPTSSLAISVGSNVNAYVPFGYWDGGTSGVVEVPLEGTGTTKHFATAGIVNSCAANSVTGDVACTENDANVDIIRGSTVTSLVSASNAYASFSGGSCMNCGVAINPANNTAVVAMGLAGSSGFSGLQTLDLTHNTFSTPTPLTHEISEDISIDPSRNLILSPDEEGYYDLLKLGSGGAISEYANYLGYTLDSAAEDCTTGIALSSNEGYPIGVYVTDLTQASFTNGTGGAPGTWTAPGQFVNFGDVYFSAATDGIASAPGSGHLAVVTGEFGGDTYAAMKLPSTSGSGTPNLADYAYVGAMPETPDGRSFSAGYDPHTITAYTSPNTGKSYAVLVDYASGSPNYLGVVDLACVLALPRDAGTHTVTGDGSACTRYVPIS